MAKDVASVTGNDGDLKSLIGDGQVVREFDATEKGVAGFDARVEHGDSNPGAASLPEERMGVFD
jgi:hypothetical protein